jgi:phosphoribosyl 1,2-cyclic phosphate phosphodiesterase
MELVRTRSFETFHHGKYSITPVRARHIDDEDCQNLLIQADGATFLYATDTGLPYEETYEFLRGYSIDALVIECTDGFCSTTYEGHLDIKECISVVNRLRNDGCLPVESRVITTHHSVRGLARHCDLERALAPHGIEPGYDGISFSVARSEIASPAVS